MVGLEAFWESLEMVHFWIGLGLILAIVEVITVSFFTLPFSLGAFVTSLFAWAGTPTEYQFGIFAVVSVAMLFVIQKTLKQYLLKRKGEEKLSNVHSLVGKVGVVVDPVEGELTRGSVKIGGEVWSAISSQPERLTKGVQVVIDHVEGATVTVVPKQKDAETAS